MCVCVCERERERERGKLTHFPPPLCCRHITDTPASEREFLENLHELDHKINFLNLQVNNTSTIKCVCHILES